MKSIIISPRRQKIEIGFFILSFLIAYGLNVYAIIANKGKWSELYSTIGYVLIAACVLYALSVVIRLIIHLVFLLLKKKGA